MTNVFPLFNTEEHEINLERIFIFTGSYEQTKIFSIENYLPFMAFCQRCGLYFNQIKNNTQTLCLYHPGVIIQSFIFIKNIINIQFIYYIKISQIQKTIIVFFC